MHSLLRYAIHKQEETIQILKAMVECESPSDAPNEVNRLVDLLVEQTRELAKAKVIRNRMRGNHLLLEFVLPQPKRPRKRAAPILALGHSDTVWEMGTLRAMPFRRAEGRLWGPGVLDMKSGIAFLFAACRALRELDIEVGRKVRLLVVSDEEVGSETSRALTEAEAQRSGAVLVLEPGTGLSGKLKTARKGVGDYTITVRGKAAHAGVDFLNGASAIVELARQIEKVAGFTDLDRGITVNPGIVTGGTRTNVIAAEARAEVDIRVVRAKDAAPLDRKFRGLKPIDRRCQITVEGGLNRPPMERTRAVADLFQRARVIGSEMGMKLEESSTGGGSDGNFTAALGIPTLDGLGGVGEGAHALNESILVDRIADRTALLAGLLAGL
jgi:glutamate carboxypeptidase